MRTIPISPLLAFGLSLGHMAPAVAGPLEEAGTVYQAGDYALRDGRLVTW